ncbi:MAG TPA: hybrid sensor histidine kinase/response regulator [Tenuifilaceae bacterium]|nr:hybrid sensor histidine kinase/response regulator [Tenuifilaceae bacterium]HOZ15374.1 hybrid sensor histidine kinase/response regulator [Tenuifilaceae bacterium]HPI45340.1 hybrid sensor histidine kinase/response regulator [Tenuifilaceae bacterium]HPN22629.1 hybrid sensor histidine kinase/response regulator [Tenuifilaceae bacterium]HPV55761.1 hybrid sensor histidine kinase/response regulator [Tenuifilaceae bacterium]
MELLDVLVVDDEPGIRSGVERILRNFTVSYPFLEDEIGFNIVEAETGEAAIEIIQKQPPAIVLLDNKLPGIQGIEVLEYINANQPNILVMMITSYASLELAVKATNIGAYDFVPKPFTPQELKASMENIAKHFFLRQMTRKLHKEGKQVRFQFLTVLSHELKSPLNAIEGYLRMMQEKQTGDKIDDYAEPIERSLSRIQAMRNLIMDLLDLTHIESGKRRRDLREIDLVLVAKSALDTMTPMAVQRDITLELVNDEPQPIFADSDDMEILLNNLISNAVKYNVKGGWVKCEAGHTESHIYCKVSDSGIGINEEDLSKLFQEFTRIKNPQSKNVSGSGLGLSIVKKIMELYSAEVKVESKPGEGSTFTLLFPLPNSIIANEGI